MLVATALVLLMTPALGLFYAGLVRSKNTLNTFMMSIGALAVATVMWALVGYSLAFDKGNGFIGGLGYAFMHGVGFAPRAGTAIPQLLFFAFQATFCIVTVALVSGAVVERMRFAPFLVFAALWSVCVYAVLAHWAFGGGWLQAHGTLDFAGGVPVEMGSGFSALAAALVVGARKDYGRQALLPHNAVYVLLGAGLLWFGWFGFNGGSGFSVGHPASRLHEHAALPGLHARRLVRARSDARPAVTAIGAATAIIVGCVGITPAGGYISPGWAMVLGARGGAPELRDNRLAHAHPRRRDARRARRPRHGRHHRDPLHRLLRPAAWNGVSNGLLLRQRGAARPPGARGARRSRVRVHGHIRPAAADRLVTPLRATEHEEALGMDVVQHGEEAYATGEGAILVSAEAGIEAGLPWHNPDPGRNLVRSERRPARCTDRFAVVCAHGS